MLLLPSISPAAAPRTSRGRRRALPLLAFLSASLCAAAAHAGWASIDAPGPQIGLFDNDLYVDEDGEVLRVEVGLAYDGQRFLRFGDIDFDLDAYDVVVIPELESGALEPALSPAATTHLLQYVQTGGVLVSFRDSTSRDHALLGSVFGWTGLSAGAQNIVTSLNATNAVGTPFAGGPATLPTRSATRSTLTTSLPPEALSLYDDGTNTTVFVVRVGLGWVVSIGWDFFNAAPSGPTDGEGWLDVLLTTPELALPRRDREVGLFLGNGYVDTDPGDSSAEASNMEAVIRGLRIPARGFAGRDEVAEVSLFADDALVDYDPASGNADSEAVLLESGLIERGHDVAVFTGPSVLFSSLASNTEVIVIPELENGDLAALLDQTELDQLHSFLRGGGTLVLFGDSQGRSLAVADALLFSTIAPTTVVSSGSAQLVTTAAANTLFEGGPATLPLQSATALVDETTLPPPARALYTTTSGDVAAFVAPVWNGGLVWLGWDFFAAAPDGPADGGWREVLDRTLALRGSFERDLQGKDVVVIPELERGTLEADLSPAASAALLDYVTNGGRLVIGGGQFDAEDFLNALFGWSLASVMPTTATTRLATTIGTDFENGPASLPTPSATRHLDRGSLPAGSAPLYEAAGEVGVLSVEVGRGEVIYLAWDYFGSEPVGTVGEEWVTILEQAVPEPATTTMLAAGTALLALSARGRQRLRNDRAP